MEEKAAMAIDPQMNAENVDERIRKIFSLLFQVDPMSLTDTSSRDSIPAWDSLQNLNLVLAIEEEFGISLTPEDATQMLNLELVREIVLGHLLKRDDSYNPGGRTGEPLLRDQCDSSISSGSESVV